MNRLALTPVCSRIRWGSRVPVMGPVMISARHRLSWTPASSKFFLLSEVSFHRCAETPRRRAKSTRRRAPSSSPPSSCLSKVRSPSPYTQPSRELFALKIPNCSFFFRAARGSWSCSTVLQWRSRWSSMGARGMPSRLVPQFSLSLAPLGRLIILLAALAIFTRVRKSDIELFRILTLVCRSKKSLIDILFAHV